MVFDNNDVNSNVRLSLQKMLFLENKFYDRKEGSLAKYYCMKSKVTVSEKFLTFHFKLQMF